MSADVIDLATRQPVRTGTPSESEIRFAKASAQQRLRPAASDRKARGPAGEARYCELVAKRLDQMCLDFGEGA